MDNIKKTLYGGICTMMFVVLVFAVYVGIMNCSNVANGGNANICNCSCCRNNAQ